MKKTTQIILTCACLISVYGCASASNPKEKEKQVSLVLNQQLKEWRGTPYRLGGNTKRGIDCSAFVQNTYSNKLNVKLPRTTSAQIKTGVRIPKSELKPGDLVFFKTNWGGSNLHVGIYDGNNQFIHASSSRGVTRSSLSNAYWSKRFIQARRVSNDTASTKA